MGSCGIFILAVGLAFDLLELDGEDLRADPLERRKAGLVKLLRRRLDGIQLIEHIEATDGHTVFEHACKLGLEGILSKRRDKPYQHGRSRTSLEVRNLEPGCKADRGRELLITQCSTSQTERSGRNISREPNSGS